MQRSVFLLVFCASNLFGLGSIPNKQYFLPIPFSYPEGIAVGPDGNIWFTQVDGNAIGYIKPSTGAVTEFHLPLSQQQPSKGPWDIIVGPDGAMWFTCAFSNEIGRMDLTGVVTNLWKTPTPGSSPRRIRIGPDGQTMWFTEAEGNNVASITLSGAIVEYPIPTFNSVPSGLTAGPDGAIWINESANSANQIVRMTTTGQFTNAYPLPTPNSVPGQILVGPDSNLWLTENGSGKIARLTVPHGHSGGVLTEWKTPTIGSIPSGMIVAADGAMWFTEYGSAQIGRITTQGVITEYATGEPLSVPWEIVGGPDGGIWYTESETNAIGRVPDCALGMVATFNQGILTLNFSVGVSQNVQWNAAISQNGVPLTTLWSVQLPAQLPLLQHSFQTPLGQIGTVTINSGLFKSGGVLVCGENANVNTSQ